MKMTLLLLLMASIQLAAHYGAAGRLFGRRRRS